MCGPFAIPLALMAAGTVAKYFGDEQAGHAQQRAYEAERARQKNFTQQQQSSFEDSLAKTADLADPNAEKAAADARNTVLSQAITPAATSGSYLPGSSSAPALVKTASDTAAGKTHDVSSKLAMALATLGGGQDQLLKTNIGIGRNSQNIGQIASFEQGSAAVLPAELQAAAYKGSTLRGIGGLAQTIGQAWLGKSLGGAGAPKNIVPKGVYGNLVDVGGVGMMQDAPGNFAGIY